MAGDRAAGLGAPRLGHDAARHHNPCNSCGAAGDGAHRALGWIWAVSLFATALISFGIRGGSLSLIHIFSVITIVTVPMFVWTARHRRIDRHRGAVRGLVTAALLAAGYFTLLPTRMLGGWLWGGGELVRAR